MIYTPLSWQPRKINIQAKRRV